MFGFNIDFSETKQFVFNDPKIVRIAKLKKMILRVSLDAMDRISE